MRIVYFCSPGAESLATLEVLLQSQTLVLAILPRRRAEPAWKRWAKRLLRREGPIEALLHRKGIPIVRLAKRPGAEAVARIARSAPDVACIAAYPWLLGAPLLEALNCPILNFHPSLLPRHRGPLPLFWLFHADDRQAGATVHLVDRGMDTGAILAQARFALPRGARVQEVAERIRRCGAQLLGEVLADWPRALAAARPQDDADATLAPVVRPGECSVDFERWGCERIWHFLHGLSPYFQEPLVDAAGQRVAYGEVLGHRVAPQRGKPGTVELQDGQWALNCRDGQVLLGRA